VATATGHARAAKDETGHGETASYEPVTTGSAQCLLDTITRAARALGERVFIRVADAKAAKRV